MNELEKLIDAFKKFMKTVQNFKESIKIMKIVACIEARYSSTRLPGKC